LIRSSFKTASEGGDWHNLLRGLGTTIAAMVPGQSPAVLNLLLKIADW
jgi:hypothetical protein